MGKTRLEVREDEGKRGFLVESDTVRAHTLLPRVLFAVMLLQIILSVCERAGVKIRDGFIERWSRGK